MATFKEYLKFTDNIEYRDKQVYEMSEVFIEEDIKEVLSKIGEKKYFLVFAHPECPDCRMVVSVLESMSKFIPFVEIDYRSISLDKELLLSLNLEAKIPSVFLIDGIKVSKILTGYSESIKTSLSENEVLNKNTIRLDIINKIVENIKEK